MRLHMNWIAYVVRNFSCLIQSEGLLKVLTCSHVHCKCDNICETVQERDVVATDHRYMEIMIYCISNNGNSDDLERPSRSLVYSKSFQMGFLCSCAAGDKISTDIAHRTISLR